MTDSSKTQKGKLEKMLNDCKEPLSAEDLNQEFKNITSCKAQKGREPVIFYVSAEDIRSNKELYQPKYDAKLVMLHEYQQLEKDLLEAHQRIKDDLQRNFKLQGENEALKEDLKLKNEALEKIRKIAKDIPGKGTIHAIYILDAIDDVTKQWTLSEVNHGKSKE